MTGSYRGINHRIVVHIIVKVNPERRLRVFAFIRPVEADRNRETAVGCQARWCRLTILVKDMTQRVLR